MLEYMFKRAFYEDARDGYFDWIAYLTVGLLAAFFMLLFLVPVVAVAIIAYPISWHQSDERPSIQRWIALTIDDLRFDDDTEFSMPGTTAITTFLFVMPLYTFVDGGLGPAALMFVITLIELGLIAMGVERLVDDRWQPPE